MTLEEFYQQLLLFDVPVAYRVFEEEQTPPYIIYFRMNDDGVDADDRTYFKVPHIRLELYTLARDIALEARIEALMDTNDIPYECDEVYIESEKLTETIYEFDLL